MDPAVSLLAKSSILGRYLICISTACVVASGFGKPSSHSSCFWAAPSRLDLEGESACGREDASRRQEGKRHLLPCLKRASFWAGMVRFPCGGFQWAAGWLGIRSLMTWDLHAARLTAARVQMCRRADAQAVSTAQCLSSLVAATPATAAGLVLCSVESKRRCLDDGASSPVSDVQPAAVE